MDTGTRQYSSSIEWHGGNAECVTVLCMFKFVKQQKDDGAKGTPAPTFIFITCNYLAILHRRGPAIAQVNTA